MANATVLFNEHFVAPASATWTDLKNGAQNSITRADISGYLWNSLVCSAPLVAGGAPAFAINRYVHDHFVSRLPRNSVVSSAVSLLATTGSVIAGATISFFVIKLLATNSGTLAACTADKALRLETLHIVVMIGGTSIATFFESRLSQFFQVPMFFGMAAVSGYFGERSLYVIGALSALHFAVQASFLGMKRVKQED